MTRTEKLVLIFDKNRKQIKRLRFGGTIGNKRTDVDRFRIKTTTKNKSKRCGYAPKYK